MRTTRIFLAVVSAAISACAAQQASGTDGGAEGSTDTGSLGFLFFQITFQSELGVHCQTCTSVGTIWSDHLTYTLTGSPDCYASVTAAETAPVAVLATRPDVLMTLSDPNLCRAQGVSYEQMAVGLSDGQVIENNWSFGCPGNAFGQLRAALGALEQKYCYSQSSDAAVSVDASIAQD